MYKNSQDYLTKMVSNAQLTVDGRDWLTLALDPFHDINHQIAGYPDADGSQTVVSCFQYGYDLAKPAGVVGTWDANIYSLPIAITSTFDATAENGSWTKLTNPAVASQYERGPLTITAGPSGAVLTESIPAVANVTSVGLPANGLNVLIEGNSRLIGMGFEVTNTTSELYKQGAVTVYRMPQYFDHTSQVVHSDSAGAVIGPLAINRVRQAPPSIGFVNLLKGTRTWPAAEGAYCVCVQNSQSNPLMAPNNTAIATDYKSFPDAVGYAIGLSPVVNVTVNAGPIPSNKSGNVQQVTPFDTAGAYFTGLSAETTLSIKVKFYVEKAPMHTDAVLSVLATPSAGLDTKALQIYSHAITQIPVGVPVRDNGLGDWFRSVLNVVKTVAGGAAGLLGPVVPGAYQLGTGINMAAGALQNMIPSSKKPDPRKNTTARSKPTLVPQKKQLPRRK